MAWSLLPGRGGNHGDEPAGRLSTNAPTASVAVEAVGLTVATLIRTFPRLHLRFILRWHARPRRDATPTCITPRRGSSSPAGGQGGHCATDGIARRSVLCTSDGHAGGRRSERTRQRP